MACNSNCPQLGPRLRLSAFLVLCLSTTFFLWTGKSVQAADRAKIEAFLDITGFDVALDSIALSTGSAPQMLGLDTKDFGGDWDRVSSEVFDTAIMRDMALEILESTLTDALLNSAVEFYASELGQRLVEAENASHLFEDDAAKLDQGTQIISDLVANDSPRTQLIRRLNSAIDASGTSLRALQEIQLRFLLAASAAGVIDLQMDGDELQAMFKSQEPRLRRLLQQSSMASAAYTYRSFSDDDVAAYVTALEKPEMQQVYELLNAVQFEIMANRFEVLAVRMADLHPSQDI